MAAREAVAPPPGFELDEAPALPPGFELDAQPSRPKSKGKQDSRDLMTPGQEDAVVPPAPPPAPTPSMMQRIASFPADVAREVGGAADAGLSLARSAVAAPIAGMAGLARNITSGQYGTNPAPGDNQGMQRANEVARAIAGQPNTERGQQMLGDLAGLVDESKLAGLNPATGMQLASIPRPPLGAMAKQGVKNAGAKMVPKVDPLTDELARKAQSMGLEIPPDMLSDNKFLRILGQASRDVPGSGSPTKGNRAAANRALNESFGGESAERISPAVYAKAMDTYGKNIGDISAEHPIPYQQIKKNLVEMSGALAKETSDVAKIMKSYIDDIIGLGKSGSIDGEAFRKLRTKLTTQMRSTSNGDLKNALSQLDEDMLDAIKSQLPPDKLETFNQSRYYYSNGKKLEPLIAKAASKGKGDMSPAALAGRLTSDSSGKTAVAKGKGGELADISAVMNRFMTEPGSSNTAERGLAYGMLGDTGTLLKSLAMYGPANVYNRWLGPALTRKMIPTPPPGE